MYSVKHGIKSIACAQDITGVDIFPSPKTTETMRKTN